jgi:hypothetical protein
MAAILNEEEASWGHTVLAAVYIFILAVDVITVIFSQSRGPLLGLLAGLFFFVFLGLLALYRRRGTKEPITVADGLRSLLKNRSPSPTVCAVCWRPWRYWAWAGYWALSGTGWPDQSRWGRPGWIYGLS